MDLVQDFAGKDMIEQIAVLERIRQEGRVDAIAGLIDLYAGAALDTAVREMIYHALFSLLQKDQGALAAACAYPANEVRLLAVRVIHQQQRPENLSLLLGQLAQEKEAAISGEIIRALAQYDDQAVVEAVLPFIQHDDTSVAGWAMEALAGRRDQRIKNVLIALAKSQIGEAAGAGTCDLRLAMAVEFLAVFPDEEVVDFLVGHIHHSNPSLRRVVTSALVAMGRGALPGLERCLESGTVDERIMAANVVGFMAERQGADILVAVLEEGHALDPNLRFAVYEALGRIQSIRSVIGLTDGLHDPDDLALIAVLHGLDNLCNAGVVGAVRKKMSEGGESADKVVGALLASRAGKLFLELYRDETMAAKMIDSLIVANDPDAIAHYAAMLRASGCAREGDLVLLAEAGRQPVSARRMVAADDSNAMLFFYRGAAADLGYEIITARDGREALDCFKNVDRVDLLITDMNMPNMTGIELAVELRSMQQWKTLPIVMATTESEVSQREIARQAGINDFISKPFSRQQFKEKIEEILAAMAG